jgi:hypothetical protein
MSLRTRNLARRSGRREVPEKRDFEQLHRELTLKRAGPGQPTEMVSLHAVRQYAAVTSTRKPLYVRRYALAQLFRKPNNSRQLTLPTWVTRSRGWGCGW